MSLWVEVTTQKELDDAVKKGKWVKVRSGRFDAPAGSVVTAHGSSQVTACGSSQVTAYDSSQVTAYGSSQVTACDSSQVRACDSSQVRAYGSSQVTASKFVALTVQGNRVKVIEGTHVIRVPEIKGVADWLDYYGLKPTKAGYVTLYKGVDSKFRSSHNGTTYAPGTTVTAPDFNGHSQCGNGLHLCPRPLMTLAYIDAKKFVAVKVKVADIVLIESGAIPDKCKVRTCKALHEVDIDGRKVA
ncbi:MAG TPA: hypothetical protein VM784_01045 [Actinomycetota bacterium]|nr:hypothetical protein [Actinomycetota bacterium]